MIVLENLLSKLEENLKKHSFERFDNIFVCNKGDVANFIFIEEIISSEDDKFYFQILLQSKKRRYLDIYQKFVESNLYYPYFSLDMNYLDFINNMSNADFRFYPKETMCYIFSSKQDFVEFFADFEKTIKNIQDVFRLANTTEKVVEGMKKEINSLNVLNRNYFNRVITLLMAMKEINDSEFDFFLEETRKNVKKSSDRVEDFDKIAEYIR